MAAKAEDRRVQRTRALLLDALLDLIVEQGYEAVTVQDIVDRANVGRSTFYAHFLDKRQLLLSGVDELHRFLAQQCAVPTPFDKSRERMLGFSLPMFQHVQSNFRFCRAIVSAQSGASMELHLQRMFAELVREEIAALAPHSTALLVPLEVVVHYTISAFLGLLAWWMNQQMPCSAEEMDQQFRALTIPGITAALGLSAVAA